MEFDPRKFNLQVLIAELFHRYVEWFQGYTGEVRDTQLIQLDFDDWRKSGVDSRSGVFRIYPCAFSTQSFAKGPFT